MIWDRDHCIGDLDKTQESPAQMLLDLDLDPIPFLGSTALTCFSEVANLCGLRSYPQGGTPFFMDPILI